MYYSKSKPILRNTQSCKEPNMKLTKCSSWCDFNMSVKANQFKRIESNKIITFREKEKSSFLENQKR